MLCCFLHLYNKQTKGLVCGLKRVNKCYFSADARIWEVENC